MPTRKEGKERKAWHLSLFHRAAQGPAYHPRKVIVALMHVATCDGASQNPLPSDADFAHKIHMDEDMDADLLHDRTY